MKQYLQKTLKDTFLIWLILEISIVFSAILYAILKVGGVSGNTSLLVAFIVLVGLIILGQAFFSTDASRLGHVLVKWLSGEQKSSHQLESLVARQNILLEKLNQNLNFLAVNSAVESMPAVAPKLPQSPKELTFQLSSDSLTKLDNLVAAIDSSIHDSLIEQRNIVVQLAQYQRREHEVIAELGYNVATQQKSLIHVLENSAAQQRSLEQLIQILEQQTANKEEIEVKAAILSPEGRETSSVKTPQVYRGMHVEPAPRIREQRPGYPLNPDTAYEASPTTLPEQRPGGYPLNPDTAPFTETEQAERQQGQKPRNNP